MSSSEDLWKIFNQSNETEDFLGFSDPDESEDPVFTLPQNFESDTDSESDEENDLIQKRQQIQNSKKNMLNKLMEKFNANQVYCQMKTSSPTFRTKTPPQAIKNEHEYSRNFYMTRKRSKLCPEDMSNSPDSNTFNHQLLIKLVSRKRKLCDETHDSGGGKRCRSSLSQPHVIIPVEDVSKAMLDNIAQHSVGKIYNAIQGTSCHQCRQKTMDTKSCCRCEQCVGIRGQFCGPCLLNRYGESVAESLLDPNWKCPVCRGFCNCSICRNRQGKCATGILIGLARKHGHTNVKDYLVQLGDDSVHE